MPRFRMTTALASRDVTVRRAVCDGCDAPRAAEEQCAEAQLWLLTGGAFSMRGRGGGWVLDPTRAMVLAAGDPFVIRHPAGPDVCLAFRGPLVEALAAHGSRVVPLTAGAHARIVADVAACRRGQGDELAVAEAVAALVGPDEAGPRRTAETGATAASVGDRDLAARLADALRLSFAEPAGLADLAAAAGSSVFHACRAFRRATGTTLSQFRAELRLRHALSLLLDGDRPLSDVALEAGFASQSHLTNRFRARFGTTPGRVRARRSLA